MTTHTIDEVIRKYVALRAKRDRLEAAHKEAVADIKSKMTMLESWFKERMREEGVTSYKSPHGTVFSVNKDYANVADWSVLLEYIRTENNYELLNKAVNKTAVRSVLDQTGMLPPGVTYGTLIDINVRKPTASL